MPKKQTGNDYLIAGATGLVGGEILKLLSAKNTHGNIFVIGRRPPDSLLERSHFAQTDFAPNEKWPLAQKPKAPIAICTLGTTIKIAGSQEAFRKVDFDFVVAFTTMAVHFKAQSVHVVTAHGASSRSAIFYNRVKGELEEKLQAMALPSLHIYHPSLLMGERKEHRPGEGAAAFAAKLLNPLFNLPGLSAVKPTPADKLAAFILSQCEQGVISNHIHSNAEILKE